VPENHRFASDAEYLPELRRLILANDVRIDFDAGHLRGMDSPVAIEAEVMWWAMFILAATGLAFWWQGWEFAAGVAVAAGLVYATLGRRWLARNLRSRVMGKALADIGIWRKLWRHGGVSLHCTAAGPAPALECRASNESWVRFVEAILQSRQGTALGSEDIAAER